MKLTPSEFVIWVYGSETKLAYSMKVTRQAVNGWKKRGFIPAPMQRAVLSYAKRRVWPLTASDLVYGKMITKKEFDDGPQLYSLQQKDKRVVPCAACKNG